MAMQLLTDELRKKVAAAVETAFLRAEKHYKQKFKRPDVRFDIRNTNGGEAWMHRNLIRLNLTFLLENEKEFLATTVPHEVAHLVAHHVYDSKPMNGKKVRPHGKEWREVMVVVDTPVRVKHSYSVASLDLHRKDRSNKKLITSEIRVARLLKSISKLDAVAREFIIDMVKDMRDL